jgi:hypothetical protein
MKMDGTLLPICVTWGSYLNRHIKCASHSPRGQSQSQIKGFLVMFVMVASKLFRGPNGKDKSKETLVGFASLL